MCGVGVGDDLRRFDRRLSREVERREGNVHGLWKRKPCMPCHATLGPRSCEGPVQIISLSFLRAKWRYISVLLVTEEKKMLCIEQLLTGWMLV